MRKPLLLVFAAVLTLVGFAFAENWRRSSGPEIVADKSFINQTAQIDPTIYTPKADGTYRISLYVEMFGADNQTYLTSLVHWTDDVGFISRKTSTNPNMGCAFSGPVARCFEVGIVHAKADTRISWDFQNVRVSSGGTYNAYVVLERLN
jgi:hypothetical protein